LLACPSPAAGEGVVGLPLSPGEREHAASANRTYSVKFNIVKSLPGKGLGLNSRNMDKFGLNLFDGRAYYTRERLCCAQAEKPPASALKNEVAWPAAANDRQVLLPKVAELRRKGLSCREIADKVTCTHKHDPGRGKGLGT
jgi:hypothetical protein